jgi:hypothetical protein
VLAWLAAQGYAPTPADAAGAADTAEASS